MEHVDEGTIHAWLDGALSAAEGERVEAHVAACADCAAAVADARGLIAASTRILSALDEVPGDVLPKRVGASIASERSASEGAKPTGAGGAAPSSPAAGERGASRRVRPWWQRPQFAAAAGIAFVAVAVSVVWQRSPRTSVSELAADRASEPAMAPLGASAPAAAPSVPPAAPVTSTPAASGALKVLDRTDAAAKGVGAMRDAAEPRTTPTTAPASAPAASAAPAAPAAQSLQAVPAPKEREEAARVPGAAAPAPPVADTTGRRNAPVLAADAITRAERARVTGEVDAARRSPPAAGVVAEGATKKAMASTENAVATTPGPLAGCYQLQGSAAARAAGASESVELLASGAGEDQARPAYVVRLLQAGTANATGAWRWSIVPGVGFALVRGTGAEAPRFVFAVAGLEGRARASDAPRAVRIDCPAR